MNIGFDAKRLFNNHTGLGNYSRTLVSNLAKHHPEHKLHLYSSKVKGLSRELLENKNIHTSKYRGLFKAYWRSLGITKTLQKDNIDIYHGLSNEIPLNILQTNIKSIVSIHDLIFKIFPETYLITDRMIYDQKFKNSAQRSDLIVAISNQTKIDLMEYYGVDKEKIKVVYQSCNDLFFEEPSSHNQKLVTQKYNLPKEFLLYVGSVEPRKNLEIIINALPDLKIGKNIPLVVIGQGKKYMCQMKALMVELGVTQRIFWLSNLDEVDELKAIYELATIMIYPSKYEGFGIPILESLLSNTPVIAANTSSLKEVGGPDSTYIHPYKVDELIHSIDTILGDAKLQKTMADKGFGYAKTNFNSKKTAHEMNQVYNLLK
jgi:glycosyltransferase involved in cell wall biosynthesis